VSRRWLGIPALGFVILTTPAWLGAQVRTPEAPWTFTTRVVGTGSSDESEPAGYKIFSAVTLEAGLRRTFSRLFGAELTIRTESREVDSLYPAGEDRRLGSLELLPLNLLLQFRLPTNGAVHPYGGVGVNLTVAWEKSGALDSIDMAGSVGPAVEVGADFDLSPNALLNVDVGWNSMTAKLENAGATLTRLKVDPISLGIGVGFRF
jgi:outer membrane protein